MPPLRTLLQRLLKIVQGAISAIVLLLMPKCPVCIAAYVAAFTGIGMSISTANALRILALSLAGLSVVYLAAKQVQRRSVPAPARP